MERIRYLTEIVGTLLESIERAGVATASWCRLPMERLE